MNREIYLGRTPDGDHVTVEIGLHPCEPTQTVDHVPHEGAGTCLSIVGNVYSRYRYGVGGGQCIDTARAVVPGVWTREDLDRLTDIWKRWHLNDMRAACAHMTLPEDASYDARKDVVCEQGSGYRYGSAWLYAQLPDDVTADIERFQRRLGYAPYVFTQRGA